MEGLNCMMLFNKEKGLERTYKFKQHHLFRYLQFNLSFFLTVKCYSLLC